MSGNIETLVKRAGIVKAVRAFFDSRGFIEVETAVRIDAPAPEPHIDCPPVATGGFLRASPELQMKKLLAGFENFIINIDEHYVALVKEVKEALNRRFT